MGSISRTCDHLDDYALPTDEVAAAKIQQVVDALTGRGEGTR